MLPSLPTQYCYVCFSHITAAAIDTAAAAVTDDATVTIVAVINIITAAVAIIIATNTSDTY